MKRSGQVVLFDFPQVNQPHGKLRPALLIGRFPGPYDDWLICMISSQIRHYVEEFDEIIHEGDIDFARSSLNLTSVIRVGRLAVVEGKMLVGSIGEIDEKRLHRIKRKIADWLVKT